MQQRDEADQKLASFLDILFQQEDQQGMEQCFGSALYQLKFKTEKCRYWVSKGICPFRESCTFAHGNEELRQKTHLSRNYKTKNCANFQETGHCRYGDRCQFVHPKPLLKQITTRKVRLGSFESILDRLADNPKLTTCGDRLRLFQNMETDDSLTDLFSEVDWKPENYKKVRLYSM